MGLLKDMMAQYAQTASQHTGVHYVPSFNDLGTNSNDDLEDAELARDQQPPPAAGLSRSMDSATTQKRTSNKVDNDWPQFETTDLHKINRADHTNARSLTYDIPKGPNRGPSVWEYIIKSEQLKGKSFKSIDKDRDGKVTAQDLQATLQVTQSDAQRMVAEADINRDNAISEDEYKTMLSHYGSE